MIRRPPRSPLFPSPPLSRSRDDGALVVAARHSGFLRHVDEGELAGLHELVAQQVVGAAGVGIGDEEVLVAVRSEEHTSELQSRQYLVCRLLLEKKKQKHRRK